MFVTIVCYRVLGRGLTWRVANAQTSIVAYDRTRSRRPIGGTGRQRAGVCHTRSIPRFGNRPIIIPVTPTWVTQPAGVSLRIRSTIPVTPIMGYRRPGSGVARWVWWSPFNRASYPPCPDQGLPPGQEDILVERTAATPKSPTTMRMILSLPSSVPA